MSDPWAQDQLAVWYTVWSLSVLNITTPNMTEDPSKSGIRTLDIHKLFTNAL